MTRNFLQVWGLCTAWLSLLCAWLSSRYLDGLLLLTLPRYKQVSILSYAPGCHLNQRLLWNTEKHKTTPLHKQVYPIMKSMSAWFRDVIVTKLELLWPVRCHPAGLCKVSVLCRHASPHCWWWVGWGWEQNHLAHNSLPVKMSTDEHQLVDLQNLLPDLMSLSLITCWEVFLLSSWSLRIKSRN